MALVNSIFVTAILGLLAVFLYQRTRPFSK